MKKLVRPYDNRVVAGVCAGIGNYFGVDPVVIRIIWVLLTLPGLIHGIIIYLILWIIIPPEV